MGVASNIKSPTTRQSGRANRIPIVICCIQH